MINVLFFGQLRELLNCAQLSVPAGDIMTLTTLRQYLLATYPDWQVPLLDDTVQVAVNQAIVSEDSVIRAGDEVAFFPPVTGG